MEEGNLKLSGPRRAQMQADIAKIKEGRYVEIEIRPLPRRSSPQNAYYWSVVVGEIQAALQDLGHDVDTDTTHELLKAKFNAKTVCNADGEVIGDMPQSTALLNPTEFADYIDRIAAWAAQFLSLVIPPPGSQTELFNP